MRRGNPPLLPRRSPRCPRGSGRQARTVLISVALVVSLLALALIGEEAEATLGDLPIEALSARQRRIDEPLGRIVGEIAVGAAPLAASAGVSLVVGGQRIDERCEEAEVQEVLESSPGCSLIVSADHAMLVRALTNIVSNAMRYARSLVEIDVETSGRLVLVHISDDGPGIREEDLPHLFERHFAGWEGKSGIGLSFVKEVADAHGARLEARNGPRGGARFTLALRARPQPSTRGVRMRSGT